MQHVSQGNILLWHDTLKHTHEASYIDTPQDPGTTTATQRQRENAGKCSVGNNNVAEHEFSTCVTGREGEEKGTGEKLGETLVFFFFPASVANVCR